MSHYRTRMSPGRRWVACLGIVVTLAFACFVAGLSTATAQAGASTSAQRLTDYGNVGDLNTSADCAVWDSGSEVFAWTVGGGVRQLTHNGPNGHIDGLTQSGSRAVWNSAIVPNDRRANDICDQVFTWTPNGGVVRLTDTQYDNWCAEVSGDRVVWQGDTGPGQTGEIFTWTPSGGVVRLTDNATRDYAPVVSGDRIAWIGATQITVWTAAGGAQAIGPAYTKLPEALVISGDRVAWVVRPSGRTDDRTLYTWAPAEGLVTLRTQAPPIVALKFDGERLMWAEQNAGLFTWTPRGGTVHFWSQVLGTWGGGTDVCGDRILWVWDRFDGRNLYSWTPSTGAAVLLRRPGKTSIRAVKFSGGRVFWTETNGAGEYALFTSAIPSAPALRVTVAPHGPVHRGGAIVLTCKVACAHPWFKPVVVFTIHDALGRVAKEVNLGAQPFGRRLSWSFTCKLPAGRYTWSACVEDARPTSHPSLAISPPSTLVVKN